MPLAAALAPEEGRVALFLRARKEHRYQIGEFLDGPQGSTPAVSGTSDAHLCVKQGYNGALP
jgi:hypothetical protein